MVTMKTDRPVGPACAFPEPRALKKTKIVQADWFLLTDTSPNLAVSGGRRLLSPGSQPSRANAVLLFRIFRSDHHMGWMPLQTCCFTFLRSTWAARPTLDYDPRPSAPSPARCAVTHRPPGAWGPRRAGPVPKSSTSSGAPVVGARLRGPGGAVGPPPPSVLAGAFGPPSPPRHRGGAPA